MKTKALTPELLHEMDNGLFVVSVRNIAQPAIVAHAQLPYVAGKELFVLLAVSYRNAHRNRAR